MLRSLAIAAGIAVLAGLILYVTARAGCLAPETAEDCAWARSPFLPKETSDDH